MFANRTHDKLRFSVSCYIVVTFTHREFTGLMDKRSKGKKRKNKQTKRKRTRKETKPASMLAGLGRVLDVTIKRKADVVSSPCQRAKAICNRPSKLQNDKITHWGRPNQEIPFHRIKVLTMHTLCLMELACCQGLCWSAGDCNAAYILVYYRVQTA